MRAISILAWTEQNQVERFEIPGDQARADRSLERKGGMSMPKWPSTA